jgi:hypothetical protein
MNAVLRRRIRGTLLPFFVVVLLAGCAARTAPPAAAPVFAALDAGTEDVYIRIVDVGPGLCVVIRIPGGHSMVYDAGHWVGQHCIKAVRELIT